MNIRMRLKSIIFVTLAMTLICVLLLTLALFLSFDGKLGYFTKSPLPSLFKAFYIVTAAYIAVSCFAYLKKRLIYAKTTDLSRDFKVVWLAIGTVAAIYAISDLVISILNKSFVVYGAISVLGALALGAYLVYSAIRPAVPYDPTRLVLICASSLFPIGLVLENHFNVMRVANSVENILSVCASCALLLYISSEAKRNICRRVNSMYFASLFLSFFTLACLSVSYIIAFVGGAVDQPDRLRDMVFMLVIAFYLACVVVRAFASPVPKESE